VAGFRSASKSGISGTETLIDGAAYAAYAAQSIKPEQLAGY
jgi:hypothetical protein